MDFFFWGGYKPCCDLQWSSNGYSQHTATHISTSAHTPTHPTALPLFLLSPPVCRLPLPLHGLSQVIEQKINRLLSFWRDEPRGAPCGSRPSLKTLCVNGGGAARAVDIGEHRWEFSDVRQFWAMFCCQIRFCLEAGPRKRSDVSLKASDSIFLINESSDGVDHLFRNWLVKANSRIFFPDNHFCLAR